ncbi:50S ribosomal protein L3 N(5)-glutamine methyltransferase [Denitrificimonas sp. JX-1]|uniref:50S ribosomal protein L3 N(5)-glutamine methyltransferase n=1 Tax=Denitrificimonas halotolerans TaxID=3098930 RepID=A0ABU5GRC7_9GAMM|nr:50S ribosomal protein L3 N(5)-glutamine methyltransferase [Denitrificimonas sp. JX-1]MDY7219177.1 50S ribosomal protein L3 N(5)-glutamine methyltransferase [Denitrificimonas sp. JX-1]
MGQSGLVTLRDYIRWAMSRFNQEKLFFMQNGEGAFDEARALVLGALHLPEALHDKYLDCNLHSDEHAKVHRVLEQRIQQRVPAAYLLEEVWFAGLQFKVNQQVMIPRSPIEELLEQQFAPWLAQEPRRILDLCAGSGCLGIACATAFPDAEVWLSELCESALVIAQENITLHQLGGRVQAQRSDLLTQFVGQRFDLIVCKPPYLSEQQFTQLPQELQYEPWHSVVAGQSGLEVIQQILQHAGAYLENDGLLVLEVGPHCEAVSALYPDFDFIWFEHSQAESTAVLALTAQQLNQSKH